MGGLLKKLENYYEGAGILSTGFKCKHRAECGKGCEPFGPKSSMVGKHYENNCEKKIPRLLVMSPDAGNYTDSTNEQNFLFKHNRTPEGVRRVEAETIGSGKAPNPHWRKTLMVVRGFMKLNGAQFSDCLREATHYFAHVNVAKCSQSKKENQQADDVLFKNCRGYLRGELAVLAPDVVFAQGGQPRKAMDFAISGEICDKLKPPWPGKEIFVVRLADGKKILWFDFPHPTAHTKDRPGLEKDNDWEICGEKCAKIYGEWRTRQ